MTAVLARRFLLLTMLGLPLQGCFCIPGMPDPTGRGPCAQADAQSLLGPLGNAHRLLTRTAAMPHVSASLRDRIEAFLVELDGTIAFTRTALYDNAAGTVEYMLGRAANLLVEAGNVTILDQYRRGTSAGYSETPWIDAWWDFSSP